MMMKSIVITQPGQLTWQERPRPEPGRDRLRIRTAACGICATDLEMLAGADRVGYPFVPGHEWSGWVDAVGPGVDVGLIGRQCVAENVLSAGGEVGFEHPGGCGEYLLTDVDRLHILDPEIPPATAALIEPLAVCVRALRRLRLSAAAEPVPVLIFGDGPIGLISLMLLRHMGFEQVDLIGGRAPRLALARELGARRTLNFFQIAGPPVTALRAQLSASYPCTIEASGSPEALATAIDLAPPQGRILVLGGFSRLPEFPTSELQVRELELIGSNASAGAWSEATRLATAGLIPLDRLVTRCVPASRFAEAFEQVRHDPEVVKLVLLWDAATRRQTASSNGAAQARMKR